MNPIAGLKQTLAPIPTLKPNPKPKYTIYQ